MNANGLAHLSLARGEEVKADLLVIACLQGEAPVLDGLPAAAVAAARELAARPGFRGKENQAVETTTRGAVRAVALRGLGRGKELDAVKLAAWAAATIEAARLAGVSRLGVALPGHLETRGAAAGGRIERHLMTAAYRFERYLAKTEDREPGVREVTLVPPPGEDAAYRQALPFAERAAAAVLLARELGNAPPNEASPAWLEARARELGTGAGMGVEVLDAAELERRGMAGILAVGAGSAQPPRLVRLATGDGPGPVVALVGKGITFDTGGISIKPAPAMDEMRYDKCGACTALAVAVTAARLGLPLRLRAYLPIAENMPDGSAYRPGDIVTCYSGKTVEIVNTDAEGRMILADALSLAVEEGAEALLEFSTLTGACMVALGRQAAGLFTPDEGLAGELLAAAERTGERLWRLPLWPEFGEQMKGTHADLKNSGERWGGAATAAAFLAEFAAPLARWAHLDIAGPASSGKDAPGGAGATGYGVALALDWLSRLVPAK